LNGMTRFDSVTNDAQSILSQVEGLSANGVLHQPGSNAVWAAVPLKSPDAAKSRLRVGFDACARRRLMFAMARQVVRTLVRSPGIAGVAVVTASPEVAAFAEWEGAAVIRQDRDAGTAEACRSAVAQLSAAADGLLMISGDIPLICTDAISALVDPSRRTPQVAIVPDRRRSGTNALLCAPPAVIPPCFGPDSFQHHLAAARSRGVDVRIVESDALSLDIDDVEDLDELRRRLDADSALLPVELREVLLRKEAVPAQ
jgi:2-phospho-L-lactate/phosphoenolpyruvate guanylyltransferase